MSAIGAKIQCPISTHFDIYTDSSVELAGLPWVMVYTRSLFLLESYQTCVLISWVTARDQRNLFCGIRLRAHDPLGRGPSYRVCLHDIFCFVLCNIVVIILHSRACFAITRYG